MGNIEPAVIQTGASEDICELTERVIEKGKKCPGGSILAPGCEMPTRLPEVNVWALMQAVSNFG